MSSHDPLPIRHPSIGAERERCFDEFEAELRAGQKPSIERYLERPILQSDRRAALAEFIALELAYRTRQGETPRADEYTQRFPGESDVIQASFSQHVEDHKSLSRIAAKLPNQADDANSIIDQSRNLLWMLLAIQEKIVTRVLLLNYLTTRPANARGSIGEQLYETGLITAVAYDRMQDIVQRHIESNSKNLMHALDALPQLRALREELEHFLASAVTPTGEFVSSDSDMHKDSQAPVVGGSRFRPIRSLARGGLGEVFVAQDQELDREVALKEIQLRHAHQLEARRRFVLEAEITGKLEHPSIVPIYGLGAYPDGRPYYAMRLIRGTSMQDVLGKAASSLREASFQFELRKLLRSFVAVCQAMQYAHARGIIHRDIKPDNIMLGDYGETLLVDWGLAKNLRQASPVAESTDVQPIRLTRSGSAGDMETQLGRTLGTPQFMSPEQAEGRLDELGPATDIYSLGATLYSILTGRPPFAAESLASLLLRVVAGQFPPPRDVNPNVAKPLEAICLRSMALQPEARYSSALALADDVERWLADEPVSAYPESFVERSWRWIRRHRSWAIAGTLSMVTVAIVATVAAVQINHARNQSERHRLEAVRRLHEARDAVDTWLTGTSDVLENLPGVQRVRQRLLEQALARYTQFTAEVSDDEDIELERARSLLRLGDVHKLLGRPTEAERAYRDAHATLSKLRDSEKLLDQSQYERANAALRLGIMFSELNQHDQALSQYDLASRDLETMLAQERTKRIQGTLLVQRAHSLSAQGRYPAAEQLVRQAVSTLTEAQEQSADDLPLKIELAHAQQTLAEFLAHRGQNDESLHWLTEAIREFELAVIRQPTEPMYRVQSAAAQIALALTLRHRGDWEGECRAYQDAIVNYQALLKALPDVPRYRESLALTQIDLAQAWQDNFRAATAEPIMAQARQQIETLLSDDPQSSRYIEQMASCYDAAGLIERDLGRFDSARKLFEAATELFNKLVQDYPDTVLFKHRAAIARSHLATLLYRQKDVALADEHTMSVVATLQALSRQFPDRVEIAGGLGYFHYERGLALKMANRPESLQAFQQAIDTWSQLAELPGTVDYQQRLAWLLLNGPEPALRDPVRARLMMSAITPRPANESTTLLNASLRLRQGEFQDAIMQLSAMDDQMDGRHFLIKALALKGLNLDQDAQVALKMARDWIEKNAPASLELNLLEAELAGALDTQLDFCTF